MSTEHKEEGALIISMRLQHLVPAFAKKSDATGNIH